LVSQGFFSVFAPAVDRRHDEPGGETEPTLRGLELLAGGGEERVDVRLLNGVAGIVELALNRGKLARALVASY